MPAKIMLTRMKRAKFRYKAFLGLLLAAVIGGLMIYYGKTPAAAPPVSVAEVPAKAVAETHVSQETAVKEPIHDMNKPHAAAQNLNTDVCWPLAGKVIQDFGWQLNPVLNEWRYHSGIDIAADNGENVRALLSGKVENVYNDETLGLTVMVKNSNKIVYYSSLSVADVIPGDTIEAGAIIGKTGVCAKEPYAHLHLAVKTNEQYIDVRTIINESY